MTAYTFGRARLRLLPAGAGTDQCRTGEEGRHVTIEWIVQRTGIPQRHIAAEGESTSHLAIQAARAALANAGIDAQSIDLIVLATSTPDNTFPATAVAVQNAPRASITARRSICRRSVPASSSRSPPRTISCAPARSSARW